jgi:ornithine decarboxylase
VVAEAGSVLARVELRRSNTLYLNEGIHGLLSELRWFPGMHPVRVVSRKYASDVDFAEFSLAGPTCDSQDLMQGPYRLPVDIRRGDWIEIGFLGAYCVELVTPFNGFGRYEVAILSGDPGWQ